MSNENRDSGGGVVRLGSASVLSPFDDEKPLQAHLTASLRDLGCTVWREVKFVQPDYMTAGKTARRSLDVLALVPAGVGHIPSRPDFRRAFLLAVTVKNSDGCKAFSEARAQAASAVAGYDYRLEKHHGSSVLSRPWRACVFTPAQLCPERFPVMRPALNDDQSRVFDRERSLWRVGASFLWEEHDGYRFRAHVEGVERVVCIGGGAEGPDD